MDFRERFEDPEEAMRLAMDSTLADTWTALPAKVVSFDASKQTVSALPSAKIRRGLPNGKRDYLALPLIPDVPVHFPSGGGYTLTFPIAPGDECLLVFASRSIDAWYAAGGQQEIRDARMHDLSDAFALVGIRSQPRKLSGLSANVQLRSDNGSLFVELNAAGGVVKITAPTQIVLDSPMVVTTGSVDIAGNNHTAGLTTSDVDVVSGTISLKTHVHSGVRSGSSDTGPPNG